MLWNSTYVCGVPCIRILHNHMCEWHLNSFPRRRGYVRSLVVPVACSGFRAWQSPLWASVVVAAAAVVVLVVVVFFENWFSNYWIFQILDISKLDFNIGLFKNLIFQLWDFPKLDVQHWSSLFFSKHWFWCFCWNVCACTPSGQRRKFMHLHVKTRLRETPAERGVDERECSNLDFPTLDFQN